jgi:hypothetical protein
MACNCIVPYIVECVCAIWFCMFIMTYPVLLCQHANFNGRWANICLMVNFYTLAIVCFCFVMCYLKFEYVFWDRSDNFAQIV